MAPADTILHSLLGAGTRYEGKLFFEGRARIDGRLEGEVHSDGLLVVGPEATVQGLSLIHISEPTRQLMSSRMPSSA